MWLINEIIIILSIFIIASFNTVLTLFFIKKSVWLLQKDYFNISLNLKLLASINIVNMFWLIIYLFFQVFQNINITFLSFIVFLFMYEWQLAKIRTLKELNNFRVINTSNWSEKIVELIRYILFELRYIPSEIIVYEDRPQYFVEYRELIEEVLGTKLTVMYVEMDGNNGYKKIEAI